MSNNCIDNCGGTRSGLDGLCDDCRLQDCPDCGLRPETEVGIAGVFISCSGACNHSIVFGLDYADARTLWNLLK